MAEPWVVSGSIETEINGVPVALPVAGAEIRYGQGDDAPREWLGITPAAAIYDELAEQPIEYSAPWPVVCQPRLEGPTFGTPAPAWVCIPMTPYCEPDHSRAPAFIPAAIDAEPRLVDVALGPERYRPLPPFVAWSYRVWLTIEEARR